MKIIVFIDGLKKEKFDMYKQQLSLYDSMAETICLDNLSNNEMTYEFLEYISDLDLPSTVYSMNDAKLEMADYINQYISDEKVLLLTGEVIISRESIEELINVSNLFERYAFVVPRLINETGLGGFPGSTYMSEDDKILWMNKYMPTVTMMPCVLGECVLIDGNTTKKITYAKQNGELATGFDSAFNNISSLLRAYSLDMADYGYATVCANHSYAQGHFNGDSDELFEKIFGNMLSVAKEKYYEYHEHPAEHFGSVISSNKTRIKILYYMVNVGDHINGSAVLALGLLKGLLKIIDSKYDITVVASEEAMIHFNMKKFLGDRVTTADMIEDIYDVCFVPFHLTDKTHQRICTEHCCKLIFWPLDLISIRSNYICDKSMIGGYEFIADYADAICFLSETAKKDFNSYFNYEVCNNKTIQKVIHITDDEMDAVIYDHNDLESDYYLVMGNSFLHKMIVPAIYTLAKCGKKAVIVGAGEDKKLGNITMYKSGNISPEMMEALYNNCKALIFPSIYEGFGIPVIKSLNLNKDVFLVNSELNHELEDLEKEFSKKMHYYNSIEELPEMLDLFERESKQDIQNELYCKTWENVARECLDIIDEVNEQPVSVEKLMGRKKHLR